VCGFVALILLIQGAAAHEAQQRWCLWAALTICAAALCDALDGRCARALHVTSPFGKELDSLADLVSFGVAPAVLVYVCDFHNDPLRVLWMFVAGVFVFCGAARLARYNVSHTSGRYFTGMPIPAAGLVITGLTIFPSWLSTALLATVVLLSAVLMVSTLHYPGPEQLLFHSPLPIRLLFVAAFIAGLANPRQWFFVLPVSYVVYGLIISMLDVLRPAEA
jgi:CDP-diacylglycerol--serine O-phosphatidyltransferase